MDITELILFQHHEQRKAFALLDDIDLSDVRRLAPLWARLEVLLEVHAEAEERFFYPRLLAVGAGGVGQDSVDSEVEDAIEDHNEIREGIRAAREHATGSDEWWEAVNQTRKANDDHMGEEEREDLSDFRRNADLQTRHEVALQFIAYEAEHAAGIEPKDKNPKAYLAENG